MKTIENFVDVCREVEMTIGYIKVLYDRTKLRKDPKSKKTLDDLRLRLFEATSELVNIPERFLPLPDIKNLLICFVGGLEDVKKLYDGSGPNSLYFRQLIIMRKRLSKIARYFEEQCER